MLYSVPACLFSATPKSGVMGKFPSIYFFLHIPFNLSKHSLSTLPTLHNSSPAQKPNPSYSTSQFLHPTTDCNMANQIPPRLLQTTVEFLADPKQLGKTSSGGICQFPCPCSVGSLTVCPWLYDLQFDSSSLWKNCCWFPYSFSTKPTFLATASIPYMAFQLQTLCLRNKLWIVFIPF